MPQLNTFYQTCVYVCIGLLVLTLSINFVNALDILDPLHGGTVTTGNSSEMFSDITNASYDQSDFQDRGGIEAVFLIGGLGGVITFAMASLTRSPAILGVGLFGTIFWASYTHTLSIINIGGFIPAEFLLIGTAAMLFVFAGAVAGMLSGSG